MKSKMNFGTWARNMLFAGGCLATAAACGDTAFAAGEWDVSFAAEGATLWWSVDGVPVGSQPAARPFAAEIRTPGRHSVSCADASGASATVSFVAAPAAGAR